MLLIYLMVCSQFIMNIIVLHCPMDLRNVIVLVQVLVFLDIEPQGYRLIRNGITIIQAPVTKYGMTAQTVWTGAYNRNGENSDRFTTSAQLEQIVRNILKIALTIARRNARITPDLDFFTLRMGKI